MNLVNFKNATYFLYIFLQADYIVPPVAQNDARHFFFFFWATKFFAYTYCVSFIIYMKYDLEVQESFQFTQQIVQNTLILYSAGIT